MRSGSNLSVRKPCPIRSLLATENAASAESLQAWTLAEQTLLPALGCTNVQGDPWKAVMTRVRQHHIVCYWTTCRSRRAVRDCDDPARTAQPRHPLSISDVTFATTGVLRGRIRARHGPARDLDLSQRSPGAGHALRHPAVQPHPVGEPRRPARATILSGRRNHLTPIFT
jgi:hypothetical protein